jgi:hypothetical protein
VMSLLMIICPAACRNGGIPHKIILPLTCFNLYLWLDHVRSPF